MSRLKPITNVDGSIYGYSFKCPGCGDTHRIPTTGDHAWGFNGNTERPTFTPSILVQGVKNAWGPDYDATPTVCHSFVTDGRIQLLNDCTHEHAGQTLDLFELA